MTCLFQKLSIIRIFSRAADQTKKTIFTRALVLQILQKKPLSCSFLFPFLSDPLYTSCVSGLSFCAFNIFSLIYQKTIFIKNLSQGKVTTFIVYVDNIALMLNDNKVQTLKKYLASEFEKKDLGLLKYFLGTEVARSRHGIFLSQRKYVLNLLKETRIIGCKVVDNPVQNKRFKESDERPFWIKASTNGWLAS
jgi:hypothetical protein